MGQKREVRIVFVGEELVARIATNEKVECVVKKDGETYVTKVDLGQHVAMPLHQYRRLLEKAKKNERNEP